MAEIDSHGFGGVEDVWVYGLVSRIHWLQRATLSRHYIFVVIFVALIGDEQSHILKRPKTICTGPNGPGKYAQKETRETPSNACCIH